MEATATFPIELRDQLARVFPPYTPLYCEENVLNLVSALESLSTSSLRLFLRSYGVFISNPQRSAALFFQKASKAMEEERWYVVWDYHVVVVVVGTEGERWVLDPDSRLGWCVRLEDYVDATFGLAQGRSGIPRDWQSQFRVVPSRTLLSNFASDRSHMRVLNPQTGLEEYTAPPPSYPPLMGELAKARGESNNLFDKFLDFGVAEEKGTGNKDEDEAVYGVVVKDVAELLRYPW